MMSFSQRMGFEPKREELQLESIDPILRMAIYNLLQSAFASCWYVSGNPVGFGFRAARAAWTGYWHRAADEFSDSPWDFYPDLKDFILSGPWNKVYDYVEFLLSRTQLPLDPNALNSILEQEMSAYRVKDGIIVPISDKAETSSIDEALSAGDSFKGAREHIRSALKSLSRKPKSDLRTAITESVSAVESAARIVTGKPKATLGDALKVLEKNGHVHPALKDAWLKIYGYTSDEHGLRHAMTEDPKIDFPTAKYMVVSCSAFVNLLIASS